jgi:DNA-binding NarL/FixJ family response regulator
MPQGPQKGRRYLPHEATVDRAAAPRLYWDRPATTEVARVKVLLVDDDTLVRKGLVHLLASCVEDAEVGEASDAQEALSMLESDDYQVVLADIRLPGRDGLEMLKDIKSAHPDLPVVMLTGYDDPEYVKGALAEGAAGYLLKDSTPEDLTQAIRVALTGSGNVLSPRAVRNLFDRNSRSDVGGSSEKADPGLTRREIDIMEFLAQGCSNREISRALFLSEKTVKAHLAAVFRKLGVSNRTKAAMAAVAMGITGAPGSGQGPDRANSNTVGNGHHAATSQAGAR